jgi:hypothetical protein
VNSDLLRELQFAMMVWAPWWLVLILTGCQTWTR